MRKMTAAAPATLLTTGEAARVLNVVPHTIRVLRKRGDLNPAAVSVTGVALYDRAELERFQAVRDQRRARSIEGR